MKIKSLAFYCSNAGATGRFIKMATHTSVHFSADHKSSARFFLRQKKLMCPLLRRCFNGRRRRRLLLQFLHFVPRESCEKSDFWRLEKSIVFLIAFCKSGFFFKQLLLRFCLLKFFLLSQNKSTFHFSLFWFCWIKHAACSVFVVFLKIFKSTLTLLVLTRFFVDLKIVISQLNVFSIQSRLFIGDQSKVSTFVFLSNKPPTYSADQEKFRERFKTVNLKWLFATWKCSLICCESTHSHSDRPLVSL